MDKIEIFLHDNDGPIPFLSIFKDDIRRLSLTPHRWIIFVMFTICGVHGMLTATPGGPAVELDTMFPDLLERYYFVPQCPNSNKRLLFVTLHPSHIFTGTFLAFIDHRALNDSVTSTVKTSRSRQFRQQVVNRDGVCVVTGNIPQICDAAHIIPRSKGDKVCYLPSQVVPVALIRCASISNKLSCPAVICIPSQISRLKISMTYEMAF